MKKRTSILLTILICFLLGVVGVKADNGVYSNIKVGDTIIYSTNSLAEIGVVDGVIYDEETKTLTLENINVPKLYVYKNYGLTIILKGENVIDESIWFSAADITIKGDGNLTINGNNIKEYESAITVNSDEYGEKEDFERITFAMTGTVTALKGFGGYFDYSTTNSDFDEVIKFDEGVSLKEGGKIIVEDNNKVYIAPEGTLYEDRNNVKVVIEGTKEETPVEDEEKNEEKNPTDEEIENPDDKEDEVTVPVEDEEEPVADKPEEKHVLTSGDVTFTAKEVLDNDHKLKIEDKLSTLKSEIIKTFEQKIKDSHLVLFYNISVVNGNDEVVSMKDGEYTIRLKLTKEAIGNYDVFTAIYVDENNEVKETFNTKVDGEYVEFTTTHLSNYGVLGVKEEAEATTPTDKKEEIENPKTGDNLIIIASVAGIALVGIAATIYAIRKRLHN